MRGRGQSEKRLEEEATTGHQRRLSADEEIWVDATATVNSDPRRHFHDSNPVASRCATSSNKTDLSALLQCDKQKFCPPRP